MDSALSLTWYAGAKEKRIVGIDDAMLRAVESTVFGMVKRDVRVEDAMVVVLFEWNIIGCDNM